MSLIGEECLIELRFPAQANRMALVRAAVRGAARFCGFDEQTTADIVLAVGEACQNVILHAYAGRDDGTVILGILRGGDGLVLRLTDFGRAIDPAALRARDLHDLRPGGLGVHFIQALMDSADFGRTPDGRGNVLRMTKQKRELAT
jgi:anti-sigma regulatory factor (Ser/Thr protein kinase)